MSSPLPTKYIIPKVGTIGYFPLKDDNKIVFYEILQIDIDNAILVRHSNNIEETYWWASVWYTTDIEAPRLAKLLYF